jgi:hypothetical protein
MKYFLIYDDETMIYKSNIERLIESIKKYSDFEIILFKKSHIDSDIDFSEKNKKILNSKRGGGYWLWKPYIINNVLNKIKNGDSLFYLDSSYYFIEDFTNLYNDKEILIFSNKPNETTNHFKGLCKMDVILKYNMFDKVFIDNAEDCWGGAIIIKKSINSVKYIKEWLDMCCIYENITDSPSIAENSNEYIEHRHDQSLLSIILYKYNIQPQYFEKKYLQNIRVPY